jgi:hypothetical protein
LSQSGSVGALTDLPDEILRALLLPEPLPSSVVDLPLDGGLLAQIDWLALRADADAHAVGVLVFQRLSDMGWTRFVDPEVLARWEADSRHADLQYRLQRNDALAISATLTRHRIRHAFIKGAGYRELLYQPRWIRLCGDSDLLIDRSDIESVRFLLHQIGFEHAACAIGYRNFRRAFPHEITSTEAEHYELAQLVKTCRLTNAPDWLLGPDFEAGAPFIFERTPDGVLFRSVLDVHWALHFILQDESPLDTTFNVRLDDGGELPVLGLEWSLFITAFKLYFEAFDRPGYGLHHLTDLAAILRCASDGLDWQIIDGLVQRHGLQAPVFYTLSAAQALAGADFVPSEMMSSWAHIPPIEPWQTVKELGDFVPVMLARRVPSSFLCMQFTEGTDIGVAKGVDDA